MICITALTFLSCGKSSNNPRGCVTTFIIALEQHDMSKAWGLLGKDVQAYYNVLGERQRRSGKGAFENEINRIKTFRNARKDYSVHFDKDTPDEIKLITEGDKEFKISIADEDGEYKIKDEPSIKNILRVITAELKPNEPGY
jgi:hypothetical protein